MDERTDMLSEALRTGLDTIREEFFRLMEPLTFANTVRGEEMAAELVMLRRRTARLEQRINELEAQCREGILTLAQNAQEAVEHATCANKLASLAGVTTPSSTTRIMTS